MSVKLRKVRLVWTILICCLLVIFVSKSNVTTANHPNIPLIQSNITQSSTDWVEMNPAVSPPARYHHWGHTAYDSESDIIILFSGDSGPYQKIFNDTWAYNYNTNTWTNITTPESKIVARLGAEMAYDSESDRIIVFGGWKWEPSHSIYQDKTDVGETWSYDYNNNTWTNHTTENSPPFRGACSMSYDEANDRMIMFGGFDSEMYFGPDDTMPFYNDTWAYDYNTNTWTNMRPSVCPPSLGNHQSVFDSESNKTILFGGRPWKNSYNVDETWVYDYSENIWTNMSPMIHPSKRGSVGMTYNSKIDRVLLFGGASLTPPYDLTYLGDTWSYDYNTNTWTDMNSPSPPSMRLSHSFDYDSESEVAIIFGGKAENKQGSQFEVADTWAYKYQANVPSPPLNLQGTLINGEVNLNWTSPKTDAGNSITEYVIYRGNSEDNLTLYTTVQGKDNLEYTDTEVTKGSTYFYTVRAKNGVGESKDSDIVEIDIPSAVTGFSFLLLSVTMFVYVIYKKRKARI